MGKKLTADEIKSILFTGVALIAALAVFFLSADGGAGREDLPSPTPETAITPTGAPSPTPAGREEEAFVSALSNSGLRVISSDAEGRLYLRDPDRAGRVALDYSAKRDRVNAWTLTFELPAPAPAPTYKSKSETPVPEPHKQRKERETAALNHSIRRMIEACALALDGQGALPSAVLIRWYDGAIDAKDANKNYQDAFEGFSFTASPTLEGADYALRVSLIVS